jgi:membrane dipeptidase
MNRRQFLSYSGIWSISLGLGNLFSSCAQAPIRSAVDRALLRDLRIIDAHAHPDQFNVIGQARTDDTSTLKSIKAVKMAASAFAAVGDLEFMRQRLGGFFYQDTKIQLKGAQALVKSGQVKLILKASDLPTAIGPNYVPGAILAIEGGDPLEGKPDRVNEFYQLGVRILTVVHYRNNELGDIMHRWNNLYPGPYHKGLTQAGRKVIERMQELGIVVDVAHAHSNTLKQIAEMTGKPLLDSHTSPYPHDDPSQCFRGRTWKDMELIAKTGGVVCTWPLAIVRPGFVRKTFLDWAREILEMKTRLGIEYVGLGTDGGPKLPSLIDGYRDLRDLLYLLAAMQEVGLSHEDVKAYMGGNFCRVLQHCIG